MGWYRRGKVNFAFENGYFITNLKVTTISTFLFFFKWNIAEETKGSFDHHPLFCFVNSVSRRNLLLLLV